jgi:hypothetical protein
MWLKRARIYTSFAALVCMSSVRKTKDTMSKKNALCTLSALMLSAVAGFGVIATPVVAVAEHHEESGDHKCSGEKKEEGEHKCSGEKKCSGDKGHEDHKH